MSNQERAKKVKLDSTSSIEETSSPMPGNQDESGSSSDESLDWVTRIQLRINEGKHILSLLEGETEPETEPETETTAAEGKRKAMMMSSSKSTPLSRSSSKRTKWEEH